jgi:hypothetical protein
MEKYLGHQNFQMHSNSVRIDFENLFLFVLKYAEVCHTDFASEKHLLFHQQMDFLFYFSHLSIIVKQN